MGNEKVKQHVHELMLSPDKAGARAAIDAASLAELATKASQASVNQINALLSSDDVSLNELQEIVTYIKANRGNIDSLGIAGVNGLQAALDAEIAARTAVDATKLGSGDVINNLTTNEVSKPLSAAQGVIIKGLIDQLNALVASDDVSLNELQEIVTYIKANRGNIDSLGITGVNGLQAALDKKSDEIWINVKVAPYNAVGDGVTDDTVAIAAAFAEAKSGRLQIYIPAGTYKVSDTFVLDWEGAKIEGDTAGLGGSVITTTSTSKPILKTPADYNHLQLNAVKLVGPGRATSTGSGIDLRGDVNQHSGGVGSNIDLLHFSNVTVTGFQTGVNSVGVANSSFDRVAIENCTTSQKLSGNSNSVTFENCAFVCVDGAIGGTIGLDIAASCNGTVISSCDAGGPTMEWCVKDKGINTSLHGGQWECYGSGIESINGLTLVGTAIREFGSPSASRWSLKTDRATVIGGSLGVRNSVTNASIRVDSTITRSVFVYGTRNEVADYYSNPTTLHSTVPVESIPVVTQATGEAATSANHGTQWKRISNGLNDSWSVGVRKSDGTYHWANMFDYFFDKESNGAPAWTQSGNTFTGTHRVTNAINPGISITTSNYGGGATQAGLFIATANNNVASGAKTGETIVVAKSGKSFAIATGSSGAQIIRFRVPKDGVQEFADNGAAITAGLVATEIYRTGDILKIVH